MLQFPYTIKIKLVEVNIIFLPLGNIRKTHFFVLFLGSIKGNIDLKWVKQLQYWQEWHNLI